MFVLIFANFKVAPYSFLTARENNFFETVARVSSSFKTFIE